MTAEPDGLAIGLIAHDSKKDALVAWVDTHCTKLAPHRLFATGTTGARIMEAVPDLTVTRFASGPLGGNQQIG
ncbi:MAG: methylglyoxal synthase, partial [Pseudomonadota bacterium]